MNPPFRLYSVLAPLFLALVTLPSAQVHNSFQARTYRASSMTMAYRLFVPRNYDAKLKYPILVAMHGVGEKGSDNLIQVDREDLGSTWIEDTLQARVPHFVMVPQCPSDQSWGATAAIQTVHDILDSLKREFSLDTNRFYAAGLSMGARGTFNLLQMKPGYFAAALACAGAGDNSAAGEIAKSPIWAFHAVGDAIVDVSGTRDMVAAMETKGFKFVRFISQTAINNPSLTSYGDAVRKGTPAVDLVAKNPTGISYDSLSRAVAGGAKYLYSELTGGDHRTGWMVAFHHPLVTGWIFSKVRGGTPVSIAPLSPRSDLSRNGVSLTFGKLPAGKFVSKVGDGTGIFSLDGRWLPVDIATGTHESESAIPLR